MARKRGGLAGLWDRNKKIIAPIATGVAGLFNPLAGAAVGAAMRGLDRPGQGGIGFDVGRGAMGALQGYGLGKGAQSLKGLFAGGGAAGAAGGGAGGAAGGAAGGGAGAAANAPTPPTSLLGRLGQAATSKEGIAALGGAAKATAGIIESQQDRAQEQRRQADEEARRRRQAELMLMFLPQMQFGQQALQGMGRGTSSSMMG